MRPIGRWSGRATMECVVTVAALVAFAAPAAALEPHDPIVIVGDGQAVVHDRVSGNGVRSGTGTAADPWVISGWRIEPSQHEPAILIKDVRGHVRIEDVHIARGAAPHAGVFGLSIVDSASVRWVGGGFEGVGPAIDVTRSWFEASDVTIRSAADPWCVRTTAAEFRARGLTITGDCGVVALLHEGGSAHLEGLRIETSHGGVLAVGPMDTFSLRDAVLHGLPGTGLGGNAEATVGLTFSGLGPTPVRAEQVQVHGFDGACVEVRGGPGPSDMALKGLVLQRCGLARKGAALVVRVEPVGPIRVSGSVLDGAHGLWVARGWVQGDDLTVSGDRFAVRAGSVVGADALVELSGGSLEAGEEPLHVMEGSEVRMDDTKVGGARLTAVETGATGSSVPFPWIPLWVGAAVAAAWVSRRRTAI